MAQSSGAVRAIRSTIPDALFTDPSTQAKIQLKRASDGTLGVSFEREAPPLSATRSLSWFIGSGRIGRSFAFQQQGFLYQSPVSWYAEDQTWRASPGFQRRTSVDLTRAVEPACLLCHSSRLQAVNGIQNQYDAKAPFLEGGVACERCHGPGQLHVTKMKAAGARPSADKAIINPVRLQPAQRDRVCAQCHLTGAVRIARAATKGRGSYTPGDDLSRTVAVFVWDGAKEAGLTVTSHFETLALSRCKQATGDRLWCGTCHDPHGTPVDVRARCVSCHETASKCTVSLSVRRTRNGDKCQDCHMPKSAVKDAEHAVYTDHSIPRNAATLSKETPGSALRELVPFWRATTADSRDLALAYATAALTEPSMRRRAFELLRTAEARDPSDLAIAAQLAQFHDRLGQPAEAMKLYERVVAAGTPNTAALINLGTLYAQSGRPGDAIVLWQSALVRNPASTQARINMAVAQIRQGDRQAGIASLRAALSWDPDSPVVAKLLSDSH
ncbi:MAG: tetratricopeptide repeat protein [Bryobacteraceae bacterium]|nr:tetratricopeptide repeat protein [Bryobacteraceae bacterium]